MAHDMSMDIDTDEQTMAAAQISFEDSPMDLDVPTPPRPSTSSEMILDSKEESQMVLPTPSKSRRSKKASKPKQQYAVTQHNHHHYAPNTQPESKSNQWSHDSLLGYLQFFFNLSLILLVLYLLLVFIWTLYHDVRDKISSYTMEVREEIYVCAKNYQQTGCGTPNVIDLAVQHCEGWKQCMERDPMKIGRVRVVAETFAEILNSFVDVMSFKTMIFLLAFSSLLVYVFNSTISNKRNEVASTASSHSLHHSALSTYPNHVNPLLYQNNPYWLGGAPHLTSTSPIEPNHRLSSFNEGQGNRLPSRPVRKKVLGIW